MSDAFVGILGRYVSVSAEFERRLPAAGSALWSRPTPCVEWDVWQLVNHMAGGNLNYARLLSGGSAEEFLRARDRDVLGDDPSAAYRESVEICAAAFREPGALSRRVEYPLGQVQGEQALAVRTADSVIHGWDLACATGANRRLDADLVDWLDQHLDVIYAGLAETPVSAETTHRFFARRSSDLDMSWTRQDRLLRLFGRNP